MQILLNAGLSIGVLMFLLLLSKSEKKTSDFLFLAWIFVSLAQIAFYQITIYHFDLSGIGTILGFALPLLGAPLLFLYIRSLMGYVYSWKETCLHLSAYLVFLLALLLFQYFYSTTLIARDGIILLPNDYPLWTQFYAIPMAISGFVYCLWDLLLLRRHHVTIKDHFSFDEKINLKWTGYVVISYFALFLISSFLIFGSVQFGLLPLKSTFALVGIALSTMLVGFGFYGFRQTAIFSSIPSKPEVSSLRDITKSKSYLNSGLTTERINEIAENLTIHMTRVKPYLNEDLSLTTLAAQCELPPTQLSQVINQNFKESFYDFINKYRIEDAKEMLSSLDNEHLSIMGIAYECGFKSKSSFNRYFKKYLGLSPSQFKKKQ